MSSVDKTTADKVIAKNGKYATDPQVIGIIEYSNIFNGDLAYKLVYKGQSIEDMQARIACRSSRIYWSWKE